MVNTVIFTSRISRSDALPMAGWLASLLSVDKSTFLVIATICAMTTWTIRGQLNDPMLGFIVSPLLSICSVCIYAALQGSGLIEPMIMTDWIKGLMASIMVGHGIGVGVGMLLVAIAGERAEAVENELTRRQRPAQPTQRTVRRNFRESVR
jgi:hypothetical protein